MAFSTTSFHFPRSWTQVIQFLTLIWQMSCLTLFSHLYLGLPCDLLVRGFHLNIFLIVLVSGILCTWPNQLSLWALTWLTIFLCFISLSNYSYSNTKIKFWQFRRPSVPPQQNLLNKLRPAEHDGAEWMLPFVMCG